VNADGYRVSAKFRLNLSSKPWERYGSRSMLHTIDAQRAKLARTLEALSLLSRKSNELAFDERARILDVRCPQRIE
jgi:hypothetical protein